MASLVFLFQERINLKQLKIMTKNGYFNGYKLSGSHTQSAQEVSVLVKAK